MRDFSLLHLASFLLPHLILVLRDVVCPVVASACVSRSWQFHLSSDCGVRSCSFLAVVDFLSVSHTLFHADSTRASHVSRFLCHFTFCAFDFPPCEAVVDVVLGVVVYETTFCTPQLPSVAVQ